MESKITSKDYFGINKNVGEDQVYHTLSCMYEVSHNLLVGSLGLEGAPQTFELMKVEEIVTDTFKSYNLKQLSSFYDLHDTVFEWYELEGIEPFNRRLTLEGAVLTDTLGLCDE